MTVFKNYFKIIKSHSKSLLLYTIIFLAIMFFSTSSSENYDYSEIKADIYLKDLANTESSKALASYLEKKTNVEDIEDDLAEDSLFYEKISAIVVIPKDFDKTQKVEYRSAPQDSYGMLVKHHVNQFLNQMNFYKKAGFSEKDAIENANKDLDKKVSVKMYSGYNKEGNNTPSFYFNFMNYPIMAQIILIVSTIMLVYKEKTLFYRNHVSPVTRTSQNLQLILGHIVASLVLRLFYVIIFFPLTQSSFADKHIQLMILNSFVFTISVVCMSVLIANLAKSGQSLSRIMNIVALGSSFLSGAFVPQAFLGKTALSIARFLPSYYYISNNNSLINNADLASIMPNMMIMLGFSAIFIVLTLIIKPKLVYKEEN